MREIDDPKTTDSLEGLLVAAHDAFNSNIEKYFEFSAKAELLAEKMDDVTGQAEAIKNQGVYFRAKNDLKTAREKTLKAWELMATLPEDNKPILLHGIEDGLGILDATEGNLNGARGHFLRSLEIAQKAGHTGCEALSHIHLGNLAVRLADPNGMFEHYHLALKLFKERNDIDQYGVALYNLANACAENGDYFSAKDYIDEAFDLPELSPKLVALFSIMNSEILFNECGNEAAIDSAQKAIKFSREHGEHWMIAQAYSVLGNIFLNQGDFKSGRKEFLKGISFANDITKCNLLCGLALASARRQDKKSAERYLSDVIPLIEKNTQRNTFINIAEVKYFLGDIDGAYKALKKENEMAEKQNRGRIGQQMASLRFHVRIEREENEKKIALMKAEHLERELSNSTLQLVAQTELLTEIRTDLLQVIRKFPMPDGAARELRERLKTLPCKSVDWERFDTQFKAAHPEFAKRLMEAHPTLSHMELRVCTLLRMNLRSAEIARLFCLSERTVEDHRVNIRKKMKLNRSEDLIVYLTKL